MNTCITHILNKLQQEREREPVSEANIPLVTRAQSLVVVWGFKHQYANNWKGGTRH